MSKLIVYLFVVLCLGFLALGLPIDSKRGGIPTRVNRFTFHVLLQTLTSLPDVIHQDCAGVILSDQWILSAANCAEQSPESLVAIVGAQLSLAQGRKYELQDIVLHPEYRGNSNNCEHDIALLRTTQSIQFNDRIQPIALSNKEVGGNLRGHVGT